MNIFAYNSDLTDAEKSYLTSSIASTATTLKVKNTNMFVNSRRVLVGSPGRERSEMVTQSAHTATTLTVGATVFSHDADDPVYALDFDQIKFYRSTTGIDGTYSVIATVDIDWDNTNNKTVYNDVNALDTYFYKVSYWDSIGAIETDLSDPIQATGYPENSVGEVILEVAAEVKDRMFTEFSIPEWMGIMTDVGKDLTKQAKKPYRFLKEEEDLDIIFADSVNSTPFPTDLWKIDYTEINQQSAGTTNLTFRREPISPADMRFRQSQQFQLGSDYVTQIAYDDTNNVLMFTPSALSDRIGAFTMHFFRKFIRITDMSQVLQTPDSLVYKYAMKRAFFLMKSADDSKYLSQYKEFDNMYQAEIRMLQREKNIEAHGPTGMAPDRKRYSQFGGPRYRQ